MYSCVKTISLTGLDGEIIDVECDLTNGLPKFLIVGLPDQSIKESAERVRAGIKNSGFNFPVKRITVNLAPASIRKDGSHMDLAIACCLLGAIGEIKAENLENYIIFGELTLDGEINPIEGALPMVISARQRGFRKVIVPKANLLECSILEDMEIYPVQNLRQTVNFLNGEEEILPKKAPVIFEEEDYTLDFKDIKGQKNMKRAYEIAAAGGHNVILIGPPGSGKSMGAARFPSILPALSFEEAIEVTKIYSVAGLMMGKRLMKKRPFRSPHHTASKVSLIGGGRIPKPGEISLAHKGVLFLDELAEFDKNVIEVLRQPLEKKVVDIARAQASLSYPADFILIAAMNPCPCGYYMDPTHTCTCSMAQIDRYLAKVSHPLLDRIDIHVEVAPVKYDEMKSDAEEESSDEIRKRVIRAREIQAKRYKNEKFKTNGNLKDNLLKKYAPLSCDVEKIMRQAFKKYGFSARSHNKIIKIARTIADLDESEDILSSHLLEAIRYRTAANKYWSK
ncbi:Mg chelatase-like protein [Clostridiales bacterium KA00134]|nr:Mg chelatase-like protein [Clostridiales bacterium KA00134]